MSHRTFLRGQVDMTKDRTVYEQDRYLSADELRAVELWREGYSMLDAYKNVMISKDDAQKITPSTLKKRVQRFFGTQRMRDAMRASYYERGPDAQKSYLDWKKKQANDAKNALSAFSKQNKPKQKTGGAAATGGASEQGGGAYDAALFSVERAENDFKQLWLESLSFTDNPTAMSVYGTGLFLAQTAVQQILKRQKEIRDRGLSPLEKDASPYSALDLNAIRTAASMLLPFAPPPTTAERKAMSLAGVLLGLSSDAIEEKPDEYTAPPPAAIDITSNANE